MGNRPQQTVAKGMALDIVQGLRSVGVLALVAVSAGLWPGVAAAEDTVAFELKDSRIVESSGLAPDPTSQLYWTVNDSGAQGVAYGVTPEGEVKGSLRFRVEPRDVEAVAMAADRLYVGDIGDNDKERTEVTVFYFDNPKANGQTITYNSWDFTYPDGAHDAETLLVDATGRLYIVTKGAKGAVYQAPAEPSATAENKLKKLGAAPAVVTDGTFLPGDKQIALLTYSSVEVIDAKTYAKVASAPIPKQKQAESLSLSLDGKSLLVGSEGKNSKVYEMAIPAGTTASASPSATTSGQAEDDPDPDDTDANTGQSRKGTFLALGLAGFVAVVAGVVVAFVRKP